VTLRKALQRLVKGGPERQAIEAGEIDAIIDYTGSNVILFPAARRAMRDAVNPAPAASRETATEAPIANSLLAALPQAEYQRLRTSLEPVMLTFGEVLYEPGAPIRHVYFPINCLVSLLTKLKGRPALEVGLVGQEGMVSIALALGVDVSPALALVQGTGIAMRMEAARFRDEFLQSMPFQKAVYRYTHALMAQIAQTAACNRYHLTGERLARWLLMTRDRVHSNEFRLTHEFLADMLGVRRVAVTRAASVLKKRKLITYRHGLITILDRKRLSAASCECYQIIKRIYASADADG
jgi:CRP-like cAMP-binding protein